MVYLVAVLAIVRKIGTVSTREIIEKIHLCLDAIIATPFEGVVFLTTPFIIDVLVQCVRLCRTAGVQVAKNNWQVIFLFI